jgi:calmodulin
MLFLEAAALVTGKQSYRAVAEVSIAHADVAAVLQLCGQTLAPRELKDLNPAGGSTVKGEHVFELLRRKGLRAASDQELGQAFRACAAGDDTITREELRAVMLGSDAKVTEEAIEAMMNEVDQNHDGMIDYDEFVKLLIAPPWTADQPVLSHAELGERLASEFTVTAVMLTHEWPAEQCALLSPLFFDGLAGALERELQSGDGAAVTPRGIRHPSDLIRVHTMAVSKHYGEKHEVKYYIDGQLVETFSPALRGEPLSTVLHSRLRGGALLGSAGRQPGFIRERGHAGRVFLFAMHRHALRDDAVRALAAALGAARCTRSWAWGREPSFSHEGRLVPMSRRGFHILSSLAASRDDAAADAEVVLAAKKPRVQPLFKLQVTASATALIRAKAKAAAAKAGMAEHGRAWQSMAEHVRAWRSMAEHGRAWRSMAEHGRAWQSMAEHGTAWHSMARHGMA